MTAPVENFTPPEDAAGSTGAGAVFSKVLVANRGEIAVRAFRACYELGARTVAVFPYEDRNSIHRQKADEAYRIGEEGHPVRAYLDVDEIIRVAKDAGADAIYPGYGFLSENAGLARAAAENGITFVGPPADVLELTGNKVEALRAAKRAGIPTLASSDPSADVEWLLEQAEEIGFPIFVKAVAGGGGRGMRRVERREDLRASLEAAMREADTAFGDPTVFLEQAVLRPRHIEVQILADGEGNVVHLFERDCSLQRRHQKVIEMAPAPNLDEEIRQALHRDAVAFAKEMGYVNAGTVEFLVDTAGERAGQHVFIEMNPRIQVEHTVTEEVTDVDLVGAQLRIAAGATLPELGITQDALQVRGFAIQCRITTEDPANGFRPDTGTITAYRSAGGSGVRLDGGTIYAGAEISPHFDSMLVKLTCRGRDYATAVRRVRRALAEFRVRGVATNIPFLMNVMDDPQFVSGDVATDFIDKHPELAAVNRSQDRGSKALQYLVDVTVNQPHGPRIEGIDPRDRLPEHPGDKHQEPDRSPFDGPSRNEDAAPPHGWRQVLLEQGPEGFARTLREQTALAVTDTTFRDAHQSLLATRVRTRDLLAAAPAVAHTLPGLLSVEAWGGATYDVALRFLHEDPWQRLELLRAELPNIPIQMLLRGRNTVGYTPYPTEVTDAFVAEAAASGVDVFRIFDALNDVEQITPAIEAVRATGTAVAEAALCYTGNMTDPKETLYTLDYYLGLARRMVDAGAHVLAIKDMAGLLRPAAARELVTALRAEFDLPVHLHTHDTAGGQLATLLAAAEAGVDAVDAATASMAGTTSQVPLSALVAALEHTERDTGLGLEAATAMEPYWESVRSAYAPFEAGLPAPTGRVYHHEIPGGQLSNLRTQAIALGLGERFEAIESMYAAADDLLGHLVKVTPSSKVVGDLALQLVGSGVDPKEFAERPQEFDIPDSVIGFLRGELGDPPGGWPEPFRTKALQGRREGAGMVEISAEDSSALAEAGQTRRAVLNRLLFPGPTKEFEAHREEFGDTVTLHTRDFLYGLVPGREHVISLGRGVRLLATLMSVSEPDEKGMRTVMVTLNGQLRQMTVRDRSIESTVRTAEKADPGTPGHVAAPFAGSVTVQVAEGDAVEVGQAVATIEAMKMEATITAQAAGTVRRVVTEGVTPVNGGDLLLVIE
ncbi:pyruvate carboxylase [Micrococcus luteus]|uniref:pyruvate carboxylase n=2 Tax=Micrococcus TaxID=1269 RepID=UPI001A9771E3|nr:pyruvate carboxylase [Micrococcus luteus]MBO1028426.1 pyruvate carboxylase [Micrococcus luteus]MCV7491266.1 pyruvate carboxylase [Micrococcus luteus]MCV7495335.1 pyruvate carboxylase [Micrococcus luteus]MCV7540674.1 pyruvate carboxylase [Micrococcus luteus]MCV7545223.1 pyruvate carboxylase [Micrococcus luteus]